MPACRNAAPTRGSSPMPRATSLTSAPVSSHTLAISLMYEIFVARNALEASLIISALVTSVRTRGAPAEPRPRTPRPPPVVPDDDAVGLAEVGQRRALAQELRAGHVREAPAGARREGALDRRARGARDGGRHHEHVAPALG